MDTKKDNDHQLYYGDKVDWCLVFFSRALRNSNSFFMLSLCLLYMSCIILGYAVWWRKSRGL